MTEFMPYTPPAPGAAMKLASLRRRMTFAASSWFFFDRLFCTKPLSAVSGFRDWQIARIPDHVARIGFDLVECIRTATRVPDIGNVEQALLDVDHPLPQHPRYRSYWYDQALHSMVGMFVGVDLIHHNGRYYVIEFNHGPSMYARRRTLYDSDYDPVVAGLVSAAQGQGFETLVPIAFRWLPLYVDEFVRAARERGITAQPRNCPLDQGGGAQRMIALPRTLPPKTMYVIHSGLMPPAFKFIDNKWYTSKWLEEALRNDIPSHTLLAVPKTSETLQLAQTDARWPNVVVKLAGSARSCHVFAGRFDDETQARAALGLDNGTNVPKQLRSGFAKNFLLQGRDRVLYQQFIPPELDARGHAQMIRLHLFVSPLETRFLSAHYRISRRPVPERVPPGIHGQDDAFVFNNADYARVPPSIEEELQTVAAHLGKAIDGAITRKFVTRA